MYCLSSPMSTMAILFTDWDNEALEAKSTGPEVWQHKFPNNFGKTYYGPDTLFFGDREDINVVMVIAQMCSRVLYIASIHSLLSNQRWYLG